MSKFGSLLKTQLNARYGFSLAKYNIKNDKKALWKAIGIGFAVIIAFGDLEFLYSFLMVKMLQAAQAVSAPQLIITLGAVATGLMILFFGIFLIIGALFLAKDTEFLASLPVSQGNIFLSKFIMVIISEYPFALFFMLPPVIIYGVAAAKGVVYYLTALLCMALIPLIPLIISSLLSLGLMRLVSRSRRRDLLTIIGSIILILVLVLGQNFLASRLPAPGTGTNILTDFLNKSDGLVALAGKAFPPSIWITRALSLSGWDAVLNFIYLLVFSAVAFGVVYLLASFIYLKGASAQLETEKKAVRTRLKYERLSPGRVLFMVEWKNLLRTPIYALNSLVGIFVGPLIMCMPLFGGNFAKDKDIQFLFEMIRSDGNAPALILIVSGILTLFGAINPAVSSSFSREGKAFWMLKNIPVEPGRQVMGKFAAGYSISFLCIVTTSVVLEIAFKLNLFSWLLSVVISMVAMIPACAIAMLIDLRKPKLNWGNPQEAIKQNMNVILGMLAGWIIIAAFGLLSYGILQLTSDRIILYGSILLALIIVSVPSVSVLKRSADKAYRRIEA